MVGTTISHYQILEKLGEGGMGVVYKARDRHLDRFVAIKVLAPGRVSDPERKRRFVQEAKAASALNHPNIIAIYDIWSDAGDDFIAMEYVAGKTLDQIIPRKGLGLSESLKIAIQIAGALAAAHRAGIVHRDVKPANIMVNHEGFVKILDFGLAKLREPVALGDTDSTKSSGPRTGEGVVIGTIAYMSPEQAEGKPVDARSDIFSFGAVLYELLSGRRAFQRETTGATLAAVLACEPPPLEETPPEVSRMVARMLSKKRESRYQSAEQLLADLDRFAQPEHRFLPRPLWFIQKLCRLRAVVVVLALAAALLAGIVWSRRGSDAVPPPSSPAVAGLPATEDLRRAQEYLQRYDRKGNIDAAIAVLLPALRRNPSSAGLHACLSEAYRRNYIKTSEKEWLQKAIESGQRAVAANDFLEAGHIALGMALFENGQKEAAAKQFERAYARNPLSGPAHLGLAKLSSGSDAEQLYLEAVQYSGDWITLVELANFYYAAARYEESIECWRKALVLTPDNVRVLSNLGAGLHMIGRYEEAGNTFQEALKYDETDGKTLANLGTSRYFQGDYLDAARAMEKVVEINPKRYLYWGNLGDCYRWAEGKRSKSGPAYQKAIRLAREQLDTNPADTGIRSSLSVYLAKAGDTAGALTELAQVENLPERDKGTLFKTALVYELAHDRGKALDALRRAIEAGYSMHEIANDPELAALRSDPRYPPIAKAGTALNK